MHAPEHPASEVLDRIDLRMARVAINYFVAVHREMKKAVPPAAIRLAEHLDDALASRGQDAVPSRPDFLTTKQVAERLGCSHRTARRIAQTIGHRVGRDWLINPESLPEQDNR